MTRYEINRKIREFLGISGRELAEKVEVTKQTISNYELGKNVNRPTERVIEWELDNMVERSENELLKIVCHRFQRLREEL